MHPSNNNLDETPDMNTLLHFMRRRGDSIGLPRRTVILCCYFRKNSNPHGKPKMPQTTAADVIIIGAGIAGIATAHYLTRKESVRKVILVDALLPMSLTSAQSGENYRNWWPHSIMTDFIDQSIDMLEGIAEDSSNRINLTHRGYALATRQEDIGELMSGMRTGYGSNATDLIRIRERRDAGSYLASLLEKTAGVDVIMDPGTVRRAFPAFDPEIRRVIHIRRAGDLDSYQLSQYMLEKFRARGGSLVRGEVAEVRKLRRFRSGCQTSACWRPISWWSQQARLSIHCSHTWASDCRCETCCNRSLHSRMCWRPYRGSNRSRWISTRN
jgi:hypothetical protein